MPGHRRHGLICAVALGALLFACLPLRASAGEPPTDQRITDEVVVARLLDCASRLDRDRDIGYGRIAARCPELALLLAGSERAAWLPASWQERSNDLSAGGLNELARLIREESRRRATSKGPSAQSLAPVLREVAANPDDDSGLWARTMSWIRTLLSRQKEVAGEEDFGLADWLRSRGIGANVWTVLTYVLFATLIVFAIYIVVAELRAAGLVRRRTRPGGAVQSIAPSVEVLRFEDLTSRPLFERPALLLRLILQALLATGRLPGEASRTRSELLRDARLEHGAQRERLAGLALRAEELRYAATPPAPMQIEASLADGAVLLRELLESQPERRT